MQLRTVNSQEDLIQLIEEIGILPFFANEIPGYSLEECVAPEYYFPDEGEGIWEWKGPVIQKLHCAYGKFFHGKAAFISKKWFLDFANWRRDGYDFDALYDDELAKYTDKKVYDLLDSHGPLLSKELKKLGNYHKGGNKGFDGIITRLQMMGYVLVSDFVYSRDKDGNLYGWGIARYETPETWFGEEFRREVYDCTPQESYERILAHVMALTGMDEKTVEHFLGGPDPWHHADAATLAEKPEKVREVRKIENWLVPANPKYFDIVHAFDDTDTIVWKQSSNIQVGNTVYMYVAAPVRAILYRCRAVEVDIPYHGGNDVIRIERLMRIKLEQRYPEESFSYKVLRESYGISTIRGPRGIPDELRQALEEGH